MLKNKNVARQATFFIFLFFRILESFLWEKCMLWLFVIIFICVIIAIIAICYYSFSTEEGHIGCMSFLLAFLCPPLWIFLYLLLYFLNKENYNADDAETE